MRRTKLLRVAVFLLALIFAGFAQAAHFEETGTSYLEFSDTLSVTLVQTCNYNWDGDTSALTIAADPGESVGDEVVVHYCYSGVATAAVTGPGYRAAGGLGGLSFTVGCPFSYTNPDPATMILNPGPDQVVIFSLGPEEIVGGDPPYSTADCDFFAAQIGDVVQVSGGVFGVVDGPAPSPGTYVSLDVSYRIELQSSPGIPVLGRWGAALLVGLIAGSAVLLLWVVRRTV